MGMPKTKAECDKQIAYLEGDVEGWKAKLADVKSRKNAGWQTVAGHYQDMIAKKKAEIAKLKAHRKSLK